MIVLLKYFINYNDDQFRAANIKNIQDFHNYYIMFKDQQQNNPRLNNVTFNKMQFYTVQMIKKLVNIDLKKTSWQTINFEGQIIKKEETSYITQFLVKDNEGNCIKLGLFKDFKDNIKVLVGKKYRFFNVRIKLDNRKKNDRVIQLANYFNYTKVQKIQNYASPTNDLTTFNDLYQLELKGSNHYLVNVVATLQIAYQTFQDENQNWIDWLQKSKHLFFICANYCQCLKITTKFLYRQCRFCSCGSGEEYLKIRVILTDCFNRSNKITGVLSQKISERLLKCNNEEAKEIFQKDQKDFKKRIRDINQFKHPRMVFLIEINSIANEQKYQIIDYKEIKDQAKLHQQETIRQQQKCQKKDYLKQNQITKKQQLQICQPRFSATPKSYWNYPNKRQSRQKARTHQTQSQFVSLLAKSPLNYNQDEFETYLFRTSKISKIQQNRFDKKQAQNIQQCDVNKQTRRQVKQTIEKQNQ